VVQAVPQMRLDTAWLTEQSTGGLTVAVVGHVEQFDVPVLRRMQHHTASALAIALDVEAWRAPGAGTGGALPVLVQQGWRCAALSPRDRLERVWQELGRASAQSATNRGGPMPAPMEVPR